MLLSIVAVSVAGTFLWLRLKASPEYSLALLVERVQRGDDSAVDEFVGMDKVVDDFFPQVQAKAVELYAKGLPPAALDKVVEAAEPLKPAIKARAREEAPALIREKTARFKDYPAPVLAFGLGRVSTVQTEGETAFLKVAMPDRKIEIVMSRTGYGWKIVGIRDETLARQVAEKIGRELVIAAVEGGVNEVAEKLGIGGVNEILKRLDDVVR